MARGADSGGVPSPAMADDIHFVDANGLRFAYLEQGSGPLVLMLHGFPDTAHTWDDLRPRIAAQGLPRGQSVYARVSPQRDPGARPGPGNPGARSARTDRSARRPRRHRHRARLGRLGRIRRGRARPGSSEKAFRYRHSASGGAQAVAEKALGRPPFRGVQASGRGESLRAQRLRGAARHISAMVPDVESRPAGVRRGARELLKPGELERRVRLLPEALPRTQRIAEGADHGAGCCLRGAGRSHRRPVGLSARRANVRQRVHSRGGPGGHFMHREHPDAFAERLLAHL